MGNQKRKGNVIWAKLPTKLGEFEKQNRRDWLAISPVLVYG